MYADRAASLQQTLLRRTSLQATPTPWVISRIQRPDRAGRLQRYQVFSLLATALGVGVGLFSGVRYIQRPDRAGRLQRSKVFSL